MDSISTSFTFSFDLRNRAHFLPPRPVDSTAYLTPPSWHSMARANPLYRSVHRPPAHLEPPKAPAYRQSTRHCLRAIPCPLRQKPTRTIAQLSLQRRFPRAGKPEGPHVDDERPRRKSPSTEARCPAQHTSAPRLRLALSDPIPAIPHAAAPPLAPPRPAHSTKRKQAPRAHEPANLLPPLLKQTASACYTLLCVLSLQHCS
jgi:hypothetical protein